MRAMYLRRIDHKITYIPLHSASRWDKLRAWLESIGFIAVVGLLNGWIGI